MQISASILSIEPKDATQKFYNLETSNINFFHIDVMDGKFVKNDTSTLMKDYALTIKHISQTPLDVHLMVEDLEYYINEYLDLQPFNITFHYEVNKNHNKILETIKYIKNNGVKVGISIKPNTDIKEIFEYLQYVDLVLIMSVEPGKGGQAFLENSLDRIKELKNYIDKNNLETLIEVDGGINNQNFEKLKEVGTDIIVVGSYLIESNDYVKTVKELKK